jgi:hypothetical protein
MSYDRDSFGTTVTLDGQDIDVTVDQRAIGDRAMMRITRDDTGESVHARLDAVTLESIRQMGIDGLGRALSELEYALRHHNWNYRFDDYFEAWKKGHEEYDTILRMCAELPEVVVRNAWAKYGNGPFPFEERKTA